MIADLTENGARYNVLRVVAHLSAPARPSEIFEIAVIDAVVDAAGVHIGETQTRLFDPIGDVTAAGTCPCTPLHLAAAIWGNWTPDVLVSHDAASAAVAFGSPLTRGLPWLSLHRIARQIWPERESYELEALSACGADRRLRTSRPSGAAREAELTAKLLSVVYADPGLKALDKRMPAVLTFRQRFPGRELLAFCDDELLMPWPSEPCFLAAAAMAWSIPWSSATTAGLPAKVDNPSPQLTGRQQFERPGRPRRAICLGIVRRR